MPSFTAIAEKPNLSVVVKKKKGIVLSTHPILHIRVDVTGGDPHELYEQLRDLIGKRVKVAITPEQGKLE